MTYSTEGIWGQQSGVTWFQHIHKRWNQFEHIQKVSLSSRARLKRDGTRTETRFCLSAKRTGPFKLAGGGQLSRLLAAKVCASAVVMVVMLDTPCSEVECKTTGYPLHSHASPSLPLPCITVCHQVSTELYMPINWYPWWYGCRVL